ncbi:unnamed protein product [Diabrotica balteata]|uniref:DnaJ homolog subfamily C member 10 n=1 Tax=Diabrotica balteata TaxID=107213 RepID=A0A9N9SR08_DIABA|nr:unnamed protein product [Diabrotica balteata]
MKKYLGLFLLSCTLILISISAAEENDYYKLLGINRDATVKEIRKAFKTLAVKLHPDKNKDDENADKNFILLARAYEVLKDPDSRKHYDLYGEQTPSTQFKKKYHSYSYYHDQFGIYDDDPIIVTLSRYDYEVNILDTNQAWFVNFYSPNCHHCHDLAPTWRKLAKELEGVIRIAAVNCEDDYKLCHQLNIRAYPTLLYYEKEFHLYEGLEYRGDRTLEALEEHVLSKLDVNLPDISSGNWTELDTGNVPWLLFLCGDNQDCPEKKPMLKLGTSLEGLVSVGVIREESLCEKLSSDYKNNPMVLLQPAKSDSEGPSPLKMHIIEEYGSNTLETILSKLPDPETIDEDQFKKIKTGLESGSESPWLFCFYLGAATQLNLQLKRLPQLIPNIKVGLIHCGRNSALCSSVHIVRYPSWGVLKAGGAFELHHGRDVLYEVANFAKESTKSKNFHALCEEDFYDIIKKGTPWFIDWYAPWCPPCRRLLPVLRKASQNFDSQKVQFGTIDCTSHMNLCRSQGINSYPTSILYNNSKTHHFHGSPDARSIIDYLDDMLNPTIVTLDQDNIGLLMRKPKKQLWLVNFQHPNCGACQSLESSWRQLAKQMTVPAIKIAQLDCSINHDICNQMDIRGYPTIRAYPLDSSGLDNYLDYRGRRDVLSLKSWAFSLLPSSVESFTAVTLEAQVLTKKYILPWIIDFYAPWCGHCVEFEPNFRTVAERLEGIVRTGKLDCEKERIFCGKTLGITAYPTVRLYISPSKYYPIESLGVSDILKQVTEILEKQKAHEHDHDEL